MSDHLHICSQSDNAPLENSPACLDQLPTLPSVRLFKIPVRKALRTIRKRRLRRNGRDPLAGCISSCLPFLLLPLFLLLAAGLIFNIVVMPVVQRITAFGSIISNQPPYSTQNAFMSGSERTNLLIIGYGGGNHEGPELTDSLVTVSLVPTTHRTTLISVPRDLLVQYPADSGNYMKINAVYENADDGKADHVKAASATVQQISLVTGLNIQYWITIDFHGFRDFIDTLGGIDVDVPDAFTADYPRNDDDHVDAALIQVHFQAGRQHMNGETAIRYARARYAVDNTDEGNDFARSQRQHLIIQATLAKLREIQTWPRLLDAMDALRQSIRTNLSLTDLILFTSAMDLKDHYGRVGLSTDNVLGEVPGTSDLWPLDSDWQVIQDYVRRHLYQ